MQEGIIILEYGSGQEIEVSPGRWDLTAGVGEGGPGVWEAEGLVPRGLSSA